MRQIQNLYRLEAHLRQGGAGASLRQTVRASQSHSIVKRIGRALPR
jgi:hypothetical protein